MQALEFRADLRDFHSINLALEDDIAVPFKGGHSVAGGTTVGFTRETLGRLKRLRLR